MVSLYETVRRVEGGARQLNSRFHIVNVMGSIASWLGASRMYLVSERDMLIQAAGEGSTEVEEFDRVCSRIFDSNLGYRFLYNLRDYAQHTGPPLSSIHVTGGPDGKARVELLLDRSALLSARFKWKSGSRAFLESGSDPISLTPLLAEAMTGYVAIEEEVLRRLIGLCKPAIATMRSGIARTHPERPASVFRFVQNDAGEIVSFSLQPFPAVESLERLELALGKADPLAELGQEFPLASPPSLVPEHQKATDLAVGVMSAWRASDDVAITSRVNDVLARPDGVSLVVSGFINLSGQLLHVAALAMGASPDALLGSMTSTAVERLQVREPE